MNINMPLILVCLTFISGLVWLIDLCFFKRRRLEKGKKEPLLVDYARSFFPIFLIVLVIRSFLFQPFRVPTGSLEPTVMPNDFLLVSQYAYGLRLPVLNTKILNIGEPKTGDIAVFRFPADPTIDYVKRVIGVPGDHVIYKNKILYINGKEMPQTFVKNSADIETGQPAVPVMINEENLNGVKHLMQIVPNGGEQGDIDVVVPAGYYFMMGDNRDNSVDSRYWGFVPEQNLVGKALFIWLSWNSNKHWINWSRIGNKL